MGRSIERRRHHRSTNNFLGRDVVGAIIKKTPDLLRSEKVTELLSQVTTVNAEGKIKYEFPQNRVVVVSQDRDGKK